MVAGGSQPFLVHNERHFFKQNAVSALDLGEALCLKKERTFLQLLLLGINLEVAVLARRLEGHFGSRLSQFAHVHLVLVVVPLARENSIRRGNLPVHIINKMIAKLPRRFMSSLPPYAEPFRIVLLGAPGVGKGTFGKKISKDSKMPIFSTGDYLRKLVARPDI